MMPAVLDYIRIRCELLLSSMAAPALAISLLSVASAFGQATGGSGGMGFSISVDGERIAGDTPKVQDKPDQPVVDLDAVDIQVKFDGLDQKPVLNVSTTDMLRSYQAGAEVTFLATSNYREWLARQEVLIYPRSENANTPVRPIAVPVGPDGHARWTMPPEGPDEFDYVLRVYDGNGRYDETAPLSLVRTDKDLQSHINSADAVAPGRGEDRTALRNIPVYGGAVTVYGRNVPRGYSVQVLGEKVPVDADNAFVIQRILPPGNHMVNVSVADAGQGEDSSLKFDREINIPANDWFYIGLADLMVGHRTGDDGVEAVRPGEFDKIYTEGRAAFYLKGKIKGQYLLTAAADTRGDEIGSLFRGLDQKDVKNFLRRIRPDEYYPVYGDDSTSFDDAPTRGKFYVRLERGESQMMWGNFKTRISGSKFLRNERALYGANVVYKSESATSFGESRHQVQAYAANADTIPTREVLAGTGGSAYFLKYQDIVSGSETVSLQLRSDTGRIIETRRLVAGKDYEIDTLQGVVLLKRPIFSVLDGGDRRFLVVQYERTPAVGDVSGMSYGGRAQSWIGDHVRVGVTGMKEETGEADQKMMGADLVLRHSEGTYLEAEIAQTEGPGFGKLWSYDGGMTHGDPNGNSFDKTAGKQARAYAVRGQVDLADIDEGLRGRLGGYYEQKDAGFSSSDHSVVADQWVWGAFADVKLNERLGLKADYEDYLSKGDYGYQTGTQRKREGSAEIEYRIDERWKAAVGVGYVDVGNIRGNDYNSNALTAWNGTRSDLTARLTYSPSDDTSIYIFGRGTVARSGNLRRNDRIGLGGETRLTDRIDAAGEVSHGTLGWGAQATLAYDAGAGRNYYLGYRLDPAEQFDLNRFDSIVDGNEGNIIGGVRYRYNDMWSAFSETNVDPFGGKRSLTTTYGVTYTPDMLWTLTAGFEGGRVRDDTVNKTTGKKNSDFNRIAPSFGVSYKDEDRLTASLKLEARFENSEDNTRDQTSYYASGGTAVKMSEDWRTLVNVDAVVSQSDQSSIRNGEYIEASVGAAYRPIANDRFNGLFKYIYLQDVPGDNQVSAITGGEHGPRQRSHILSVDGIYDVNNYLSIGAKYGVRVGETSSRIMTGDGYREWGPWLQNIAHLGVIRADFHVVRNWDLMAEARVLHVDTKGIGSSTDLGAVFAVYRHFGDNVKAGVGYNFGRFSDDLRDHTLNDQGVFFNLIGKL